MNTALFQKVAHDWLKLNFVIIRLDRFSQWETNSCLGEEVDSNSTGDEATFFQMVSNTRHLNFEGGRCNLSALLILAINTQREDLEEGRCNSLTITLAINTWCLISKESYRIQLYSRLSKLII
jgi:hypothetical protein